MPTDLVGKIYKSVDLKKPETVERALHAWIRDDLALGPCANSHFPEPATTRHVRGLGCFCFRPDSASPSGHGLPRARDYESIRCRASIACRTTPRTPSR